MHKQSVIYIDSPKQQEEHPVEFTHYISTSRGAMGAGSGPSEFDKVVYLGRCEEDGDMFAAYRGGRIYLYKGQLNSGKF